MEDDGKKITVPTHVCHPTVSPSLMKMAHRVSTLPEEKKITHYENILISRSVAEAEAETEVKLVCLWKQFIA